MSIWNERYGKDGYAYGTEPNRWLEARAGAIRPSGRVLCLADGEGRNGTWLARQGFAVETVDGSSAGVEKALRLAARLGVALDAKVADLNDFVPTPGRFDGVVLVFAHMAEPLRRLVHGRAEAALAPGGRLILEAFTPRQLAFKSGGPKQLDMLQEPASVRADFPGLTWEALEETEVELDEGPFHQGRASVVRGVGLKG